MQLATKEHLTYTQPFHQDYPSLYLHYASPVEKLINRMRDVQVKASLMMLMIIISVPRIMPQRPLTKLEKLLTKPLQVQLAGKCLWPEQFVVGNRSV